VTTAERAVCAISRGHRILIGSGAAEPVKLVEALVSECAHFADNEIVHLLTLGPAPYCKPGLERHFRHTAFFIGANVRSAVQEGRADFMPVFLSEIPELIRSRRVRVDAALVQVSPPDEHGYVSLGVAVDIVRSAVGAASLVIAEVNPNMPRTLGDSFLPVSEIDYLVPVDAPLFELAPEPLDDAAIEIGKLVASLIPNGATIQAGIGSLPDAVLAALANHHDIGIHTEMMSDGMMKLADAGVVTGRKKAVLPGKMVTSFIMGSRALYAWADDNPAIEMRPSDFTNDPFRVARHDNMIAINSALAVDLTGQVAADTLMGRFFSGIGGQVDFIRGAARSVGGKPIIAIRSTAKDGAVSRIQAVFDEGAGVVTSRGDVRFVVTEYGIADLWGKNIRQRALALIAIAHPDFRGELLEKAKARHMVFVDQVVSRAEYPWEEARTVRLRDGAEVHVRPVKVTDEAAIQRMFYALSDESIYTRFLSYKKAHPHEEIQRLVDLDYADSMGLVVMREGGEPGDIVAMARYDVDPATRLADIAFVVRDDWQGKGLGSVLMGRMKDIGRANGLAGFTADVLLSNKAMIGVLYRSGLKVDSVLERGVYTMTLRF
jgi:acyl-CoA hydrolase/GNAT superfamily N-acetyltransferase